MSRRLWHVPSNVAEAVRRRWPTGDAWSRDVELELHDLCTRFKADPVKVFDARYGFVVAADAPGRRLVLRASADPRAKHQASVSLALARLNIGPAVVDVIDTATGTWTVMDRVVPGTPLARLPVRDSIVPALVALFRPMLEEPAPSDDLPLLTSWLRHRLLDDSLTDLAPGRTVARASEREQALSILDDLGEAAGLCHGDTSSWNILLSGDDTFRLIDPRGMSGELAYDLAIVALKAAKSAPPHAIAGAFSHELAVERDRLDAWTIVADAARV